jgi:hypothetical protein
LGLPHTSRPLKAIAGDGLDANVCADVYNLYVKYIVKRALSLLATHLPFVDSGSSDKLIERTKLFRTYE